MSEAITERTVLVGELKLRVRECGVGPAVLLCHGFPDTSYAWRHQLVSLASAGYHVIAPDQRGFGRSEAPIEIESYSILHLVGDMVGLLAACGIDQAVVVGHDWGGPVAWASALLRPDLFRAVVGLGVPWRPPTLKPATFYMPSDRDSRYYQMYFQIPGEADRELNADPRATILKTMYALSGSTSDRWSPNLPWGSGFLSGMSEPPSELDWFTNADLAVSVAAFSLSGFTGPLNWYRNVDRNNALLAPMVGAKITVPSLLISGAEDMFVHLGAMSALLDSMPERAVDHRGSHYVAGAGHWVQQEKPDAVNTLLIDFLASLEPADRHRARLNH